MGDSNNITVSTEFGDVVVHKMALRDYADLLRALDKLPDVLKKFAASRSEAELKAINYVDLIEILPSLLAEAWPDVIGLISVPTNRDAEFLGKVDGPDAVDIIVAIIQLNDFKRIMESVKKLAALKAKVIPISKPKK